MGIMIMASTSSHGQIDDNLNGLSDIWEAAYPSGLVPGADIDGDGFTNLQEAAAGTNPHRSNSLQELREFTFETPGRFTHRWPTVAGIVYQPMVEIDMKNWSPVGAPVIGTGEEHEEVLDATAVISSGRTLELRIHGI